MGRFCQFAQGKENNRFAGWESFFLQGRVHLFSWNIATWNTLNGDEFDLRIETWLKQMACENTAEATKAGLAAGITAVELDISMSQDKVFIILYRWGISDQTKTIKNHFSSKKHLQTYIYSGRLKEFSSVGSGRFGFITIERHKRNFSVLENCKTESTNGFFVTWAPEIKI